MSGVGGGGGGSVPYDIEDLPSKNGKRLEVACIQITMTQNGGSTGECTYMCLCSECQNQVTFLFSKLNEITY